jgi:hypothetical protein
LRVLYRTEAKLPETVFKCSSFSPGGAKKNYIGRNTGLGYILLLVETLEGHTRSHAAYILTVPDGGEGTPQRPNSHLPTPNPSA